tara:strand:- start:588 stop:749 length:162 start_codon:yes stop_codon:yes gene_type:complete
MTRKSKYSRQINNKEYEIVDDYETYGYKVSNSNRLSKHKEKHFKDKYYEDYDS